MNLIEKAFDFAEEAHRGQIDDSGKPYFNHLCTVLDIVSQVTQDEEIQAAAMLHDTLEDTKTTFADLVEAFGERVAGLVLEVTHEKNHDTGGYYFPRLKSRDAILIKYADRLHNLSRMEPWDEKRREQYIKRSKFWKSNPYE